MLSSHPISCHLIHASNPQHQMAELLHTVSSEDSSAHSATCFVPVGLNPSPSSDYPQNDLPYSVCWSIDPSLLLKDGLQVQVHVDGCQKGQPRFYEQIGQDGLLPSASISGLDDGLWVLPDGTRRRPWVMSPIKTTHPHSALSDKYILDRVGSVQVTFKRATVVPTSHVVPLVPVFNGGAPLPDRIRGKISHWTKLGYLQHHPLPPELGLVADEVHETLASFTFYYRSQEILERLLPLSSLNTNSNLNPSGNKVSFPSASLTSAPDSHSVKSAEESGLSHSQDNSSHSQANRHSGIRRAFGGIQPHRHSLDTSLPDVDQTDEKAEFGRLGKLGGKRVRAVSLKVAKRYSLLSNKSGDKIEKQPSKLAPNENIVPSTPSNDEHDPSTMGALKKEVIQLRAEIIELKKFLNLL
ncbi:hypothetical protein O181_099537 [Austropuccinia psidii MF-1]|uniref:DUF7918 domain-containing protein n=1 Tax=Austropuccinia psidii MF-1 TaxID=1389203 RepID=A0A9Q3PGM3_9BASI|nr:hypothetical protein [Austropuccinia psidii MF-1]